MNNKVIYIGLGILFLLAFTFIGYTLYKTNELKEVVASQKTEIELLKQNALENDNQQKSDRSRETDILSDQKNEASSEKSEWDVVVRINTFDAYIDYIQNEDNNGIHHKEVVTKLLEMGKAGWLYSGRTLDNINFSEDQITEVTWRKSTNKNLRISLPKIGDIVSLISPTARRTYPDFLPRTEQNGLWERDQFAYVTDVKMEGKSAVIIKIIYK